jgi:hypothetical protein
MMRVDKTEDFLERMRSEGIEKKYYPSTQEDYENISKFNEQMEKIRREDIFREHQSYIDASKCIFTC